MSWIRRDEERYGGMNRNIKIYLNREREIERERLRER